MKKIKNLWLVFICGIFGVYTSASAQALTLPNPLTNCSGGTIMTCVVTPITNFLLMLATPICAIMVLWGGFEMMTSGGDPEKFSTGRSTVIYAAVGFIVVLLANSVAQIINTIFTK